MEKSVREARVRQAAEEREGHAPACMGEVLTFGEEVSSDLVGKRFPNMTGNPFLKGILQLDPLQKNTCHKGRLWVHVTWGYDEAPRELYSYVCACGAYV